MAALSFSTATSTTTTLSTLNPDIIRAEILTRLDGPSLAAIACASSQFLALCTDDKLWREICSATWSSIDHPHVHQVISTFTGGHRSFFSDSFPLLEHLKASNQNQECLSGPSGLISAVDIHYKNNPIFSNIQETDTTMTKFLCSPFRIELHGPNDIVSTPIQHEGEIEEVLEHLKESLILSWIVIDPISKRAANMSSRSPVSLEWPCTARNVQLYYSTIMAGDGRLGLEAELVECRIVVTCSGLDEGEVHVDDVSMEIRDIEGRRFDGRESLVILQEAIVKGERKRGKRGEGEKNCKEFERRKIEQKPIRDSVVYKLCYPIMIFSAFCVTVPLSMALSIKRYSNCIIGNTT
ncbi:F-box protein At2g27310-like [Tripterygium wilfordii]|uniref:F-box protein At2g27310-like n=1 Tax=Tripterygium wilfordii TaxID=458696 RepID=UPI0018F85A6C|nr:F-box protein At2g27310-like [Tripterygium wilfordii]